MLNEQISETEFIDTLLKCEDLFQYDFFVLAIQFTYNKASKHKLEQIILGIENLYNGYILEFIQS